MDKQVKHETNDATRSHVLHGLLGANLYPVLPLVEEEHANLYQCARIMEVKLLYVVVRISKIAVLKSFS